MWRHKSKGASATETPFSWWSLLGSNQGPTDYESVALTDCAKGPNHYMVFVEAAKIHKFLYGCNRHR